MALSAQLLFENTVYRYNILKCDFDFSQDTTNAKGKEEYYPNKKARGGHIEVVLLSPGDEKTFLHDWLIKTDSELNGGLFFDIMLDGKKQQRIVLFQGAKCISLEEKFESQKDEQMTITVKYSAQHVHFGNNADFFLWFVKDDDQAKFKGTIEALKKGLKENMEILKKNALA